MLHCDHDPSPWVDRSTSTRHAEHDGDRDLAPRAEYCADRRHYVPDWVTVKVAAALTGKATRTIYEWIEDDRLASRLHGGVLQVLSKAALRIAPTVRRGRPRGKPTRR